MVGTSLVNEASPHILEGLKNLVNPDVSKVASDLRNLACANPDQLRYDAPVFISKAADWILSNSEEICSVMEAGIKQLPMSRPMLMEAFNNCVSRWTDVERLRGMVREECSNLNVGRPLLPQVVFHNLAGNLFISGWETITHATLLGAASMIRCSELDWVFPGVWAHALSVANPDMPKIVAVCEWSSSDTARFQAAVGESDAIVGFGSDDSVQALRKLVPWNKPFAGHGSTISFSLVTAEDLRNNPVEWLAEGIAYDFAAYDQQGCLSPRALFVEDRHPRDVDRVVDALYAAAKHINKNLPRATMTLEDRAAQARKRDEVLLDAACGGSSRRVSGDQDPFLITVKPVELFGLGPVNRYFDVYLYKQLDQVEMVLLPFKGHISTLGVADPRRPPMELLNAVEIKRVCELGSMQIPPLSWCLDGLRPLQKMFRHQTVQLPG
jgi:hypothetical protein